MKVIIVGAGIAGLSLAISLTRHNHQVVLVESAPQLAELGAGIQLTPQAIKYLFKWGLKDDLLAESIVPDCMYIRHYQDGRLLGTIPVDQMATRYGAPYIVVHRAVLHSILHKHAAHGGAEIRTDARVVTYDFAAGAVELHTGERLEADIVVAADGTFLNLFAVSACGNVALTEGKKASTRLRGSSCWALRIPAVARRDGLRLECLRRWAESETTLCLRASRAWSLEARIFGSRRIDRA